jgi:hypothetical protein
VCLSQNDRKTISITIDDLPLNIASKVNNQELRRVTVKLLDEITRAGAPVSAFVNEDKLIVNGRRDDERVSILNLWLEAGLGLGNHTFAHKSQNQVPVAEAKEDILKGGEDDQGTSCGKGKEAEIFPPSVSSDGTRQHHAGYDHFVPGFTRLYYRSRDHR